MISINDVSKETKNDILKLTEHFLDRVFVREGMTPDTYQVEILTGVPLKLSYWNDSATADIIRLSCGSKWVDLDRMSIANFTIS